MTKPYKTIPQEVAFLKIKLKSLACEARIIRQQELKTNGSTYNELRESMYLHRVVDVRFEARATLLAYNFLRGRTYLQTENRCRAMDDYSYKRLWKKVRDMVYQYGGRANGHNKEDVDVMLRVWREAKVPSLGISERVIRRVKDVVETTLQQA